MHLNLVLLYVSTRDLGRGKHWKGFGGGVNFVRRLLSSVEDVQLDFMRDVVRWMLARISSLDSACHMRHRGQ